MAINPVKYKVCDVAKDFNIKSNEIIDTLNPISEKPKKAQTALTNDELDIIFEKITNDNQVESFDEYFKVTAQAPVSAKKNKTKEPAPVDEKSEGKKDDKKNADNKPDDKKSKPQTQNTEKSKPFEKRANKQKDKPMQSRTKGDVRTVDTRSSNVELDKYNEKYENIAPESARLKDNQSSKKQKINQKSKQMVIGRNLK